MMKFSSQATGKNFPAIIYALKFSYWKKPIVRRFFPHSQVRFVRKLSQLPTGATLAVWGNQTIDWTDLQQSAEITLLRLEDGFLRSVGLGADLIRPLSWVIDSRGLYYDATRPSDLEFLLQTSDFSELLLNRARALRETIVKQGLTKYNVGSTDTQETIAAIKQQTTNRKLILVPGQVETDASLAFGAPAIRRNIDLLQAVRIANPQAYILYKPHPDVVAGLRAKGQQENQAQAYCDQVIMDISMGELLPQIDEVHVLTSLAGFEALLRHKKVTCYGLPFYAGWGLTTDKVTIPRRTRRLCLNELIAATLILYPTYISRITDCYISAEQALEELLAWRVSSEHQLPTWRKKLRPLLSLIGKK